MYSKSFIEGTNLITRYILTGHLDLVLTISLVYLFVDRSYILKCFYQPNNKIKISFKNNNRNVRCYFSRSPDFIMLD